MKKGKHHNVTADECLLTYSPASSPSPLQVSTPETPVTGRLNTAASNKGAHPVYCNKVLVAVPVGSESGALFADSPPPSASCNTSKWNISSTEIKSGRELGLDNDLPHATFTFECRAPNDSQINYNLVFSVQGQMTQHPYDCVIKIRESSGTTNDPNTFTHKDTSYTMQPSTPQFYLQNFVTRAAASPTVPATEFANGAEIQFAWESNGTFFQLYQKNVTQPIYAGTQTTFTLKNGVARDTTFFLVAMMSGDPSEDLPVGDYQPIYLYDALAVTISNPDLTPRNTTVSGDADVGGSLIVRFETDLLRNASISGTLDVGKYASLSDTLTVSRKSALHSAQIYNSLTVGGATSLNGGLTARTGPVSIFSGAQQVTPGAYMAYTDGLVIGVVSQPPSNKLCVCWITGSTTDIKLVATGGSYAASVNGLSSFTTTKGNSFVFPVSKGHPWNIGVQQMSGNDIPAPTSFYWVPLGQAPIGATFERFSDEQPEFDVGAVNQKPLSKENKVLALVDVFEEILKRPIENATKEKLVQALLDLQTEEYVNEVFPAR